MSRFSRCFALLLVLALAGCATPALPLPGAPSPTPAPTVAPPTPAPTPIALETELRVEPGGYSLRHPAGWQSRVQAGNLALAPSVAALDATNPGDSLVLLIEAMPIETLAGPSSASATFDAQSFFELSSAGPLQAGYSIGASTPITIAGQSGLAADLNAGGEAGRMITLLAPPQAVRIVGQAAPDAWPAQRPLFDAIVASMSFFAPPVPATPTPADQATQPVLTTEGPAGFVLRLGGNSGPRGGRFASARGMAAAPNGTLYMAESGRGVWVFAPDGALITTFGKDTLLDAYDVARGPDGDLFVADFGRNAIARFRPNGDLVRRWGETGSEPQQFGLSSPQRIAIGPDGSVYALDSRIQPATNRAISSVVRFNGDDGSFIERIDLPAGLAPNDLAVDAQGYIYLAETFEGAVLKVDRQGQIVARLGEAIGESGIAAGAVDIDRQGNIYVATWSEGILKFAPNGALLAQGGGVAAPGAIPQPGEFSLPNGIVTAPGGIVWVSDNSGEYSAVTALRLVSDPEAQATAEAQATVEATPAPAADLLRQWAASASASSFYEGYSPDNATGPPNVEGCMDSPNAWASADPNGLERLELRYATPVFATEVHIHQNHRPGFITRVELLDERDRWTTVYTGAAALQSCPLVQTITFPQTLYRISGVRLTVDQRSGANWNEIDAVELVGIP